MRIEQIRIRQVAVARAYATSAADRLEEGEATAASTYQIIELITDDGTVGLGEVSDIAGRMQPPTPDDLTDLLRPALVGAEITEWRRARDSAAAAVPGEWHPEYRGLVRFGVEIALLDLAGKHYGAPVYELLGGRVQDRLEVSWVAYIRGGEPADAEVASLEEEVGEKVAEGFRAFKLKVGADHARDRERIRALRALAPDAYFKVDASGVWEEAEAIEKLRDMAEWGVDACESPIVAVNRSVANDDPERINVRADEAALALARVRASAPMEIIEHVADLSDGFSTALLRHRAVDVVNVIPSQGGGILRGQRLIHAAETAGVRVLLGSTIEMGPGTAAFLHLGVTSRAVSVPSDLVSPGLLVDDIVTPRFAFSAGTLSPSGGAGLGVSLDEAAMARLSVAR